MLRAFAQGCAALTGTEAISDGVPAFKPPEWKNARATLTWMGIILAVLFLGISYLATQLAILPDLEEAESVVSMIARAVFGEGPLYYLMQGATMLILVLAANTAFADFPRLSWFLARDHYMPHQFSFRGDRLAFSTGISTLGLLSAVHRLRLRRRHPRADPALRDRRLRRVHLLAGRAWSSAGGRSASRAGSTACRSTRSAR